MQRITALFLTLVYFGFFTGTVVHADVYNTLAFKNQLTKESPKTADNVTKEKKLFERQVAQLQKTIKHLPVAGKSKLPRGKTILPADYSLSSQRKYYSSLQAVSLITYAGNSSSLYLKNCVFRI